MQSSRRRFLIRSIAAALYFLSPAELLKSAVQYRRYHRCLPDYLERLAAAAYERRNRRLAGLDSVESIQDCREWVRKTFWELIGGKMEQTPLNSRTTGAFERPGYRVEKVVFESQPGFHVPGNLYIPTEGEPPFPGVLFQMGHALNGKASPDYQRCCQGLARLGFLVFGFDPMGQGERAYYPKQDGYTTRLSSADEEHTRPGRQMILIGDTSTRLQVWDAVRALDFLSSHPLVDPSRLASTGNSGGATLTMLLVAVDDRIQVAALSCGNTENHACRYFIPPGSTDDAEQNLLGGGPRGFDRWDLLYPFAPKPLLFLNSSRDFFGTYSPNYLASGREEYLKLREVYEVLGQADQIRWIESPLPHNLSYAFRLEIYRWMSRWLKGGHEVIDREPDVEPEKDRLLFAGTSGNIAADFSGETPFSLNRKRASRISTPDRIAPDQLRSLLGIESDGKDTTLQSLGRTSFRSIQLEAAEVQSDGGVWVPAWMFYPQTMVRKTLILVEPYGRSVRWREDGLYQELARRGFAVCAPDIRWIGDLRPEYSRGARNHASWHQDEEAWAWACLMLGSPLLGQRVTDLLALFSALVRRPEFAGSEITLAARGHVTVPALIAASLSPAVGSILLSSGLTTFRSIVEEEDYSYPFGNFVPSILKHTDLPQIASLLGTRRLTLAGSIDGSGSPVPETEVRQTFKRCRNLRVLPDPAWDAEIMAEL